MASFKSADWDKDASGDVICTELFKPSSKSSVVRNQVKKSKKKTLKQNKLKIDNKKSPSPLQAKCNVKGHIKQSIKLSNASSQKRNTDGSTVKKTGKANKVLSKEQLLKRKLKKKEKKLNKHNREAFLITVADQPPSQPINKREKLRNKLQTILKSSKNTGEHPQNNSLRGRMLQKLKSARFRYLNEQIYTASSKEAQKIFQKDPESFKAYHEGYRQQVSQWPLNPLDSIIKSIRRMPKSHVVADFGCGDAKLAHSVEQTVHSFDLVAANERVTACDMSRVPLEDKSVDVAVFCLSLMGTNLQDYLLEANRVLKIGAVLKLAEVESRFDNVDEFVDGVQRFGFKKAWKDLSHNLFYMLDFKKDCDAGNKKKLPTISLHPCLYKKR